MKRNILKLIIFLIVLTFSSLSNANTEIQITQFDKEPSKFYLKFYSENVNLSLVKFRIPINSKEVKLNTK